MKAKYEFWKDWKKVTKLEMAAIETVKVTIKKILLEIPKSEIISIYLKGSFIRREMNKHSDVDIVTILKSSKYAPKLKRINTELKKELRPKPGTGGYTLWQLKYNKKIKRKGTAQSSPSRFVGHLPFYKLVHGKALNQLDLCEVNHESLLKGHLGAFRKWFLPSFKKGELDFQEIIKQVFWLVETEQILLGKKAKNSWKALDNSIKDKDHIIHQTYKYRLKKPKDKGLRRQYIKRLETYLNKLEMVIK
jgi:predicted nucleotidyltransferase